MLLFRVLNATSFKFAQMLLFLQANNYFVVRNVKSKPGSILIKFSATCKTNYLMFVFKPLAEARMVRQLQRQVQQQFQLYLSSQQH